MNCTLTLLRFAGGYAVINTVAEYPPAIGEIWRLELSEEINILPPVPDQLTLVSLEHLISILERNPSQSYLAAGVTFLGSNVYGVCLMKPDVENARVTTWNFQRGHYDKELCGLYFLDSERDREILRKFALSKDKIDLTGLIPADLVSEDANIDVIRELIHFALGFTLGKVPRHDWKKVTRIISDEPEWLPMEEEYLGLTVVPHTCCAIVHGDNKGCICSLIGTPVVLQDFFQGITLVPSYVTPDGKTLQEREFSQITKQ